MDVRNRNDFVTVASTSYLIDASGSADFEAHIKILDLRCY